MQDLPVMGMRVWEHPIEQVCCPACGQLSGRGHGSGAVWAELASAGGVSAAGASCVPCPGRDEWVTPSCAILVSGYAAHPPPVEAVASKRRGRQKQSAAKSLLDDLLKRADQVLARLYDLSVPLTNNQAERDLRMVQRPAKDGRTISQR